MTPEQAAYRDMWLAELGPVVREYYETDDEKAVHNARNALLSEPVEKARRCA